MSYFARYTVPKRSRNPPRKNGKKPSAAVAILAKSVQNPFAVGLSPRIPDGKHWLSNTLKLQTVKQISFAGPNQNNQTLVHQPPNVVLGVSPFPDVQIKGTLDLLFFPGLNNMLMIQTKNPENPMLWRFPNQGGPGAPPLINGVDYTEPNGPGQGSFAKVATYSIPIPFDSMDGNRLEPTVPFDAKPKQDDGATDLPQDINYVRGFSEGVRFNNEDTTIQKWRLVSSGLRISLVNNATSNSGWFEAHRVNIPKNSPEFDLVPKPWGAETSYAPPNTNAQQNPADLALYQSLFQRWYINSPCFVTGKVDLSMQQLYPGATNRQFTNRQASAVTSVLPHVKLAQLHDNPTYVSGKLRDIDKIVFRLKPSTDEHDYKDLDVVSTRTNMERNYPYNEAKPVDGILNDASAFVDDAFDAIHIRIHGEDATKLLLHAVGNYEVVYTEASVITRLAGKASQMASEVAVASAFRSIPNLAAVPQPRQATIVMDTTHTKRKKMKSTTVRKVTPMKKYRRGT